MSNAVRALIEGKMEADRDVRLLEAEAVAMLSEHRVERDETIKALEQVEQLVKRGKLHYGEWFARGRYVLGHHWWRR